jgi:hypothetical protein
VCASFVNIARAKAEEEPTYDEETGHRNEGHDHLSTLSKRKTVDGHERLRGIDAEDGVEGGRAEQEEDDEGLCRGRRDE